MLPTPDINETNGTLTSYAAQRLASVGMTLEDTEVPQYVHDDDPRAHKIPTVRADYEDNMVFCYPGLDGSLQTYAKGQKEVHYEVKRLKNPKDKHKYKNPKDTGARVFITPKVYSAWSKSEAIETLFIVEGQMKALAGAHYGAHMLGIGGIWLFQDARALKRDIERILIRCQVRRVVLLFDADARQVLPEYVTENRDLASRLRQFFAAVMAFREAAQSVRGDAYEGPEVYYAQVKHDSPHKGIDDLLAAETSKEARVKIIENLCALPPKSPWFEIRNCSVDGPAKLKTFFNLSHYTAFYSEYENVIGEEEFVWQGGHYKLNAEGVVEQLKAAESFAFINVGSDYYKIIYGTNAYGTKIRSLRPWKKSEISFQYGTKFLKMIDRFDGFCNIPHRPDGTWVQTVETSENDLKYRDYNLYTPLPHLPEKGGWGNIESFLQHIFREQYEIALDWLQLLYLRPTQKLPIICLVSDERGTGKTTFLKLLNIMFGSNATIVGNDDFNSEFNAHFISKLVVGIDEGFIEKKAVLERIKSMNTADRIGLRAMQRDKSEVDCLLHFALTSNNVDTFLQIDPEENRFWVRNVHRMEGKENPDLLMLMAEEMPGFLHHLINRQLVNPKQTRFWFDYNSYRTAALDRVMAESRNSLDKALDITLERLALERGRLHYYATVNDIMLELKKDAPGEQIRQGWLLKTLRKIFGDNPNTRIDVPDQFSEVRGVNLPINWTSRVGRFFDIQVEKWYKGAELDRIKYLLQPIPDIAPAASPKPLPADTPEIFKEFAERIIIIKT